MKSHERRETRGTKATTPTLERSDGEERWREVIVLVIVECRYVTVKTQEHRTHALHKAEGGWCPSDADGHDHERSTWFNTPLFFPPSFLPAFFNTSHIPLTFAQKWLKARSQSNDYERQDGLERLVGKEGDEGGGDCENGSGVTGRERARGCRRRKIMCITRRC